MTAPRWPKSVLLEELAENTAFLRNDDWCEPHRKFIRSLGFDPQECMLGAFMESEKSEEFGLIVFPDFTSLEYRRLTDPGDPVELEILRRFDEPEVAATHFPAAAAARDFARAEASS